MASKGYLAFFFPKHIVIIYCNLLFSKIPASSRATNSSYLSFQGLHYYFPLILISLIQGLCVHFSIFTSDISENRKISEVFSQRLFHIPLYHLKAASQVPGRWCHSSRLWPTQHHWPGWPGAAHQPSAHPGVLGGVQQHL